MNTDRKPEPSDVVTLTVKELMEISDLILDVCIENKLSIAHGHGLLATFYIPLWLKGLGYDNNHIKEALKVMVNRVIAENN